MNETLYISPCLSVLHSVCAQTCTAQRDSLTSSCGPDRTGRERTSAVQLSSVPGSIQLPSSSLGSKLGCKCIPFFFFAPPTVLQLVCLTARPMPEAVIVPKKSKLRLFFSTAEGRSLACREGRSKKNVIKAAAASHKDFRGSQTWKLPEQEKLDIVHLR